MCALRVLGRCPHLVVAIQELPDNPGAPASTRLDAIAGWVRDGLLECRHEPVWLEVTGLLPHPAHRLVRLHGGWVRVPLGRADYDSLVRRVRDRRRPRGPQPWRP